MASLPPQALHALTALKAELLSRSRPRAEAPLPPRVEELPPRRADVESQQRMRHAKRSKATVASRYYQRGLNW
jgi:hypothetical protein